MIIHKQLMMFMKIWKTILQQKKGALIVFDDIISDIKSNNKQLSPIVTEMFLKGRKLNILLFLSLTILFQSV